MSPTLTASLLPPTAGRAAALLLAAAALSAWPGCRAPEKSSGYEALRRRALRRPAPPEMIDPTRVPLHDDIVAIYQFWPNVPWLYQSDRVVGFRVTSYFVSGQTEKGAFVPGTIFAWLYTLSFGPDGRPQRQIVHVWELPPAEAMLYRVRKKAVGGYYYGFMLEWPPNLELGGKLVEIEFGYQRRDGTVVTSAARRFRVPLSRGALPPPTTQGRS